MSYFINRDDIISALEDRLNSKIKESAGMKFPEYAHGLSGSIDELKSIIDIIKNQQETSIDIINRLNKEIEILKSTMMIMINKFDLTNNNSTDENSSDEIDAKWVHTASKRSHQWICSNCGEVAYYPPHGDRKNSPLPCQYKFCPNCSARMNLNM